VKPRYLLDTHMCIYLLKRQPAGVAARFARCFVGEVAMSAVTLAELEHGVPCSGDNEDQNRTALDLLLEDIPALPFDAEAARACGPIQRASREKSRDALDKLIAAHAAALGVTLATNNEADFAVYQGLRLENWVEATA
jgi:tRNA(fMet)-specific endonuclease VapC